MRAILILFLFLFVMTFVSLLVSEAQLEPSLMPVPTSVQMGTGRLVIDTAFSVGVSGPADPRLQRTVELFLNNLRRQTGMSPLDLKLTDGAKARLAVRAERTAKDVQELAEDESYALEITPAGAKLNANTSLGIMRGLQTFLQLVQTTPDGFAVPAATIHDQPRFPWRGLMIDVGRHFIPLDVLKRNLDGMAALKLNVFHWHLSENQGFRVESKRFPRLQEMGSDGLYYTQDQVRDLIAYAHDRGIRVVPEFDMPGHSTAWFVGYPELASGPGPFQIERKWGIFDPTMNPTDERTYKFLDKFIGEMAGVFPDQYFHIGGDEVNGKEWDANPKIQAFMRSHGLKSNQDLQAYFNQRVQKIVSKHGKIMLGWDEVLHPELPKDVVIESWRGQDSLAGAAKQGFRGLLSFGYYLDLMWPAERHYAVDPMSDAAATLSSEDKQRILGGEACMWSEYVSPENIDSRIWPRMAVIAERLWSSQDARNVASMYARMEAVSAWLEWLGLSHNSSYDLMLRRIAGSENIAALRTLADVLEPLKDYNREDTAPVLATSLDPLNRLMDAVRPESMTARRFAGLVDALLAGQPDSAAQQEVRHLLTLWHANESELQPLAAQSFLLQEVIPLSRNLSDVADAGLEALEYIDRGQRPSETWTAQQLGLLERAQKQQAQLLLMIVPPVQKLVQAAASKSTAPTQ